MNRKERKPSAEDMKVVERLVAHGFLTVFNEQTSTVDSVMSCSWNGPFIQLNLQNDCDCEGDWENGKWRRIYCAQCRAREESK